MWWQSVSEYWGCGALYTLAALLYAAAFAGAVLPYPGCFVALAGCICHSMAQGEPYPGWQIWVILTGLATFGTFIDNITTAMGARRFGGGKWAFRCSILGLLAGSLFFFPIGVIVGPFLGAFAAEFFINRSDMRASAMAGVGAMLGLLAGVVGKLVIIACMIGLIFLT